MILKAGRVIEKKEERKQKYSGELYMLDISVCNTNLQGGYKKWIQIKDEQDLKQ